MNNLFDKLRLSHLFVSSASPAQQSIPTTAYFIRIALFAIAYFLIAKLGFLFPFSGEIPTLLWPGHAFGLAMLLLFGLRLWPGIAIASIFIAISNNHSLPLTLAVTLAHTAETMSGAWLLRRFTQFSPRFEKFADVRSFAIFGACVGPLVGATLGVFAFSISPEGASKHYTDLFAQWWLGHSMSIFVISPALLLLFKSKSRRIESQKIPELMLVYSAMIFVSILIFVQLPSPIPNLPLGHAVFPFLLWLAIRFTQREVAIAGLVVSLMAMFGTVNMNGPFSRPSPTLNLFLLLTFVLAVMLMSLIISVIMAQRAAARVAIEQKNELLESHVLARTTELQATNSQLINEIDERKRIEAELQLARDQAFDSLNLKNEIIANLHHDARTPLNVILLYAEMMQRESYGDVTDSQKEKLETIIVRSKELNRFLENLLDVSHDQTEEAQRLHVETIEIAPWINNQIEQWIPIVARQRLTIDLTIDPSLPVIVETDPEWLAHILDNLIDNSIKFTNEGEIQVSVGCVDESFWQLQVADTGIGVAVEHQAEMFSPFWQADPSVTRKVNRGSGLGLSIVKRRVELLNGRIHVHSKLGKGTTIQLHFPYATVPM